MNKIISRLRKDDLRKKGLRKDSLNKKSLNKRKMYRKANEEGYTFDELDEDAKQKAIEKERYGLIDIYNEDFQDYCDEQVNETFPNSDVKYTYSLSYSQGDGFGLYGEIDLEDALKITGISFSEDEKEILSYIFDTIQINNDRGNTFFTDNMINVYCDEVDIEDVLDSFFDETMINNINIKKITDKTKELEIKLRKYISDFCYKMENEGYDYIYPTDEDVIEFIKVNDCIFDEYGKLL